MDWPILSSGSDWPAIERLLDRGRLLAGGRAEIQAAVSDIIGQVRAAGDTALTELARQFDGAEVAPDRLRLRAEEFAAGAAQAGAELRAAIVRARANIRRFHEGQRRQDLLQVDETGSLLGYRFVPLRRVGVYVPGGAGGLTPLISTVLMNVIPAQVAGVSSIVVCTPPRADGCVAPGLLAALDLLGISEVYRVGGAQAVAAMAYGTGSIERVDKIVGPGNRYVTEAKRQVFGQVGLDLLAGPSEIAIIADESADPRFVAADLLAQAEHDSEAGAFLLTPVRALAESVRGEIAAALPGLPRAATAQTSLAEYGGAIVTPDLAAAVTLVERLAPEHLEILTADPLPLAAQVRNAGAIFLGPYSPEAIGDYVAGTNHVLPTNGTARFASGLGVDDFLRRISLVHYSRRGFLADAPYGMTLAKTEGLDAHALSLARRLKEASDR